MPHVDRQLVLQVPYSRRRRTRNLVASTCLLTLLTLAGVVQGQQEARLMWDANPAVDAGGGNLAGYILSWGTLSATYTSTLEIAPDKTATVVTELPCVEGRSYYFALQAFNDKVPREISGYSNEVRVACSGDTPIKIAPRSLGNVVVVIITRG